jgi:glycosyltransferase
MKVSIITATYNSENNIDSCIKSVVNQDYKNIELLIIDGKSKDNTINLIKKSQENYDNIKYISEEDKGIYDALNKGITMATGQVIGFVHSDDILATNNIISRIVEEFSERNVDGVYGDLVYTKQDDINKIVRYWKSKKFENFLLRRGWMPAHPTLYLKKEVYNTYGLFNLEYKIAADYDFVTRIFSVDKLNFSYIPKVITRMRLGGASNASINHIIRKSKEDFKIIRTNKVGGFSTLVLKNISKFIQFARK